MAKKGKPANGIFVYCLLNQNSLSQSQLIHVGLRSGPETQNTTANVKTQQRKNDVAAADKYR